MKARDQERAFVAKIQTSPDFISWLLNKTKFKGADVVLKLARCDNPWYRAPTTGRESETDILIVFEYRDRPERFALHIENKRLGDKFRLDQPKLYHERAKDWSNVPKWGSYGEFEVLLIAPREFYARNKEQSDIFHHYVSHEEIAVFIPDFATTLKVIPSRVTSP
jgi:hypothetical protein